MLSPDPPLLLCNAAANSGGQGVDHHTAPPSTTARYSCNKKRWAPHDMTYGSPTSPRGSNEAVAAAAAAQPNPLNPVIIQMDLGSGASAG